MIFDFDSVSDFGAAQSDEEPWSELDSSRGSCGSFPDHDEPFSGAVWWRQQHQRGGNAHAHPVVPEEQPSSLFAVTEAGEPPHDALRGVVRVGSANGAPASSLSRPRRSGRRNLHARLYPGREVSSPPSPPPSPPPSSSSLSASNIPQQLSSSLSLPRSRSLGSADLGEGDERRSRTTDLNLLDSPSNKRINLLDDSPSSKRVKWVHPADGPTAVQLDVVDNPAATRAEIQQQQQQLQLSMHALSLHARPRHRTSRTEPDKADAAALGSTQPGRPPKGEADDWGWFI